MSTNTSAQEKKKWAFPLGIVIVVLAVIGLVTVIIFAVRGIGSLTDNSDKFEKYEQFLSPVIMNDPDPFDDVSGAQMSQLIDASIWSLMKSDIDIDQYEYAEGDVSGVIVPQKDVEKQFAKLFGTEIKTLPNTASAELILSPMTRRSRLISSRLPALCRHSFRESYLSRRRAIR